MIFLFCEEIKIEEDLTGRSYKDSNVCAKGVKWVDMPIK